MGASEFDENEAERTKAATQKRVLHAAEGAASGAVAGGAMGAVAGPPGIAAGAALGAIAGALTGAAMDADARRAAEEGRELDEEIGVGGGSLGAPNLKHPPARMGAYSAASLGGGGSAESSPAEGPLVAPEP